MERSKYTTVLWLLSLSIALHLACADKGEGGGGGGYGYGDSYSAPPASSYGERYAAPKPPKAPKAPKALTHAGPIVYRAAKPPVVYFPPPSLPQEAKRLEK